MPSTFSVDQRCSSRRTEFEGKQKKNSNAHGKGSALVLGVSKIKNNTRERTYSVPNFIFLSKCLEIKCIRTLTLLVR